MILAAVIASRHATLAYPAELSADESELLVQIDRYQQDLMPWRSVDGSTIGPMNPWFLLVVKQTGWPMTYAGIHFLGAVLLGLIAAVGYHTARLFLPFPAAGLVGLAGALTLGCSASINFMYYATELLPALMLCLGVLAFIAVRQGRAPAPLAVLTFGAVCSGLAPWAKLQAAPVSLLLAGFVAWAAWVHGAPGRPQRRRVAGVFLVLGAAALPSLAIVAAVCGGGVFPDFWASYVVANLGYTGNFTIADAGQRLADLLQYSQLNGLIAGTAALALFCLGTFPRRPAAPNAPATGIRLFAGLGLAAAVFSCIRPPHGFGHYHIFLIGPLLLALGALVHRAWAVCAQNEGGRIHPSLGTVAAICALAPVCVLSVSHYRAGAFLRQYLVDLQRDADRGLAAVVTREIARMAPRATTMAVWGWMPSLYVKSGLRSATRHPISHFLIDPGPSRDFLRRQYLRDVRSVRPDVIVDAVASDCFTWFWPVESSGIESFPELAAYVHAYYIPVLSVMADQAGVPLRVFVRKPPGNSSP